MQIVFLALGSNEGDRLSHLRLAAKELGARGVEIEAKSRIYRSDSVGSGGKGEFLNAVLRGRTSLSPTTLLHVCQEVEQLAGRALPAFAGAKRGGERALDVDILLVGDEVSASSELQLPHPRALLRPFVLAPLLELLDGGGVAPSGLEW